MAESDPTRVWDDTVLPFQLDKADVRGRIARLDGTLEAVLGQHAYPEPVSALVAEAVMLTALIGQTINLDWKLSLQVRGEGPIKMIATDYFGPGVEGAPASMRGYASFDAEALKDATGPAYKHLGRGMFAILIDQGSGGRPYQGITPLAGGSLAACTETYFAQSEQLPTRFALSMGQAQVPGEGAKWRAGGIMLQHMPKASPFAKKEATGEGGLLTPDDILDGEDADNWTRATLLVETVEATELIGPHVGLDQLLLRLFHEEDVRVSPSQPVRFGCTCSAERVVRSLSIYSAKDIAQMTDADGRVTADCQFCGARYRFEPQMLGFEATKTARNDTA
ncbi:MAG: Hsp33 family molecular chaperone HslO [Pseudomonadota bacterium]